MICPPEIILEILSHLHGPVEKTWEEKSFSLSSSLAACALVSRQFLQVARPLLYSKIEVADTRTGEPDSASRLDRTLQSGSSNLSSLIRSITLKIAPRPWRSNESTLRPMTLSVYESPAITSILARPTALKFLALEYDIVEGSRRPDTLPWDDLNASLRNSIRVALSNNKDLRALRSFRIGIPPDLYRHLPHLHSMDWYLSPSATSAALPVQAQITHLRCIVSNTMLTTIIRDYPAMLQSIEVASIVLPSVHLELNSINLLLPLLAITQKSLTKLKVYFRESVPGACFAQFDIVRMAR